MKIKILTLFPEMFEGVLSASILGRARAQGLLEVSLLNIRPFSASKHKNTDDYPFGGGAGMVMMAQPVMDAMAAAAGPSLSLRIHTRTSPRPGRISAAGGFIWGPGESVFPPPWPGSWQRRRS